jgi:hypothetical protein
MGLFLADDDGYVGDFATLLGLAQMRAVPHTPLLQEFLRRYTATHQQALAIAKEVKDITVAMLLIGAVHRHKRRRDTHGWRCQ